MNKNQAQAYWDYEAFVPEFNDLEGYEVTRKLGRGKYSEVFQGVDSSNNKAVVIKVLKPVKHKKIKREIKIMETLRGGPNVVTLYDIVKDTSSKTVCLINEYIDSTDFKVLFPTLTDFEVRYYAYELLKALDFAHSKGIMHRDIKPHNVMIDHANRKLRLIDWGLAEFYHPNVEYNVRVASRYYKGPELLVNMKDYDYSLDMWSFGCLLAGMTFKIQTMFRGTDNNDQLVRIAKVMGTKPVLDYVAKYDAQMDPSLKSALGNYATRPLSSYVTEENKHLASSEAIDLLTKLLVIDHNHRLSAAEAMKHPYFEPVRRLEAKLATKA